MSANRTTGGVLPNEFTLTIKRGIAGGWFVTSDAHHGFLTYIDPDSGLADGLRQVPSALRVLLIAQMDADREKKNVR